MSNPFSVFKKVFVWLGKEIGDAATWLPKLISKITGIEKDIPEDIGAIVSVLNDVEAIAAASVKDSSGLFSGLEEFITAVTAAYKSDGLNILSDEAVISAVKTLVAEVTSKSTWEDVVTALGKLLTDYDTLKGQIATQLGELEGKTSTPATPTDSTTSSSETTTEPPSGTAS